MYPRLARTCYIAEDDPELPLLQSFPLGLRFQTCATTCSFALGAWGESNLVSAYSQALYQLSYTAQPQSTHYLHPHTLAMYLTSSSQHLLSHCLLLSLSTMRALDLMGPL